MEQLPSDKPTVYFDGACPLCRKEIGYYQRKDLTSNISWIDISRCDQSLLGPDLSKQDALRRFHVRKSDGKLVSGGSAFVEIWKVIPTFQWLGQFMRSRAAGWILEALYRSFLLIRPTVQKIIVRLSK